MDINNSAFYVLRIARFSVCLLISATFSGCTTYYHKLDHLDLTRYKKASKFGTASAKSSTKISDASVHSLAIDAKQRVVFFTERDGDKIVCAEPSPDALSALSSNFSSSFQNNSKAIASLGSSISESAASIGLRTQSIQLLRDGMYRSCEAYAAGAIGKGEYNRQQRRYQNLMLSLLAIEQITGAVVAQPVGLGSGKASGTVGEGANDAAVELAQAEKDLESAQSALNDANETQATNSETCSKVEDDKRKDDPTCNAKDADAKNVTNKQEAVRAAELKRDNAKLKLQIARSSIGSSAGGAAVGFGAQYQNSKLTDTSAKYVAEAARTIVSTTLLASFAQEECTKLWDFISPGKINKLALKKSVKNLSLSDEDKNQILGALNASDFTAKSTVKNKLDDLELSSKSNNSQDLTDNLASVLFNDRDKLIVGGNYQIVKKELTDEQFDNLVNTLIKNCDGNTLSGQAILYTPQYPAESRPLEILNIDKIKPLKAGEDIVRLQIIGGSKPYAIKNPEGKIEAELESGEVLVASRPKQSNLTTDDETTIFVVDASGEYKEVRIPLPK